MEKYPKHKLLQYLFLNDIPNSRFCSDIGITYESFRKYTQYQRRFPAETAMRTEQYTGGAARKEELVFWEDYVRDW